VIRRGLTRLAVLVGSLAVATVVAALVVAALTGASVARSISVGLMFVGAFAFVAGAAVGFRGPVRPTHRPDGSFEGITFASPSDRIETLNVSHILVAVGVLFVLVGVVVAPNVRLF
jgi:hypothetical protein